MDKIFSHESGYTFDFTNSISAYKVDVPQYHDLPTVDFIVETENNFLFIEIKNADNIKARANSRREFLTDLQNKMYPYKASIKFIDTILRKWSVGDSIEKPVICLYILEFNAFSKTDRGRLREKIFNLLPFSLNKHEFCGRKLLKKFELLSVEDFSNDYLDFCVCKDT